MLNRLKMLKYILRIEILIILTVFLSCSENPPEIEQVFWQSNRFNDLEAGEIYDTLSLFVQVTDADGIEDIASIYIINDKEELFWKISEENRVIKENQGVTWIGSNKLKMNDRSMFPSGEYRVLVIDEAGERMESSFQMKNSSVLPDREQFPDLKKSGNIITADKNTSVVWTYSSDGSVITENYTDGSIKKLPLNEKSSEIFLYRFDRINGTGLVSGPYSVSE